MWTKRVVVTDHVFLDVDAERRVAEQHGASFDVFTCEDERSTAMAVADADVAFVNFAPVTPEVLKAMRPGATVIRYGVGVDNVDLEAAAAAGVQVANVPDYGTQTVADHATSLLLSLARRVPQYSHGVRTGGWMRPGDVGRIQALSQLTVGFVGMGRIAEAVLERLRPFGCRFVAHDPYADQGLLHRIGAQPVSLIRLAEQADAISLHAASTPETHLLIDRVFLERIRPGTILVNTARGALVDHDALADALIAGRLSGAALDVTDPEPLPTSSILRGLPQVILTPHAAFYDDSSLALLQQLASEEAGRALRGEPLRCPVHL